MDKFLIKRSTIENGLTQKVQIYYLGIVYTFRLTEDSTAPDADCSYDHGAS